jgi:hypothetical protein
VAQVASPSLPRLARARPEDVVAPRDARSWRGADWLTLACYLAAAVAVTYRLWADPARMAPTIGDGSVWHDIYVNTWGMRYAAAAIARGRLPALVTTAVNAPQGINLMWNTTMLLPSVLLTPVTLLAGPQASLTVLTTLGFAGSAGAMFVVLRRWGASTGAAAFGGALFGFSPALLMAVEDHYPLQFAVLLPLIIDAALRLVTGRGKPVRTGVWLGLLVSAQVFISEELLVDVAIAGLVMVAILIANRPREALRRWRPSLAGLAVAAGITLVICGGPLWVQFHGPLTQHGSPWGLISRGTYPADFVTAPDNVLFHGNWLQFLSRTGQASREYFAYLGWPLLGALLVAAVACWRDLRARLAAISFAVLELFSLGAHTITVGGWHISGTVLPWHWVLDLPVVNQAFPYRLPILADGAAAVLLAFAIDRVAAAIRKVQGGPRTAAAAAAVTAGVLVILPVLPRPVPASPITPVPAGWTAVINRMHLPAGAPVLVLPLLNPAQTMEWQAVTGEPFSVVSGYCIAPNPNGSAGICGFRAMMTPTQVVVQSDLNRISVGVPGSRGPTRAQMAEAIRTWRPAAVVTIIGSRSRLARYLTGYFGRPTAQDGSVLGWRVDRDG